MIKKQEKATIAIEVIYATIWLAVIVATGIIGSASIGLAMIALDAIAILYGGWLALYSIGTGNLATTITLLVVMIGNVASAIIMSW